MKNLLKRVFVCCLFVVICWSIFLLSDRNALNNQLIRFHVVANSNSETDQKMKETVKEVILASIQEDLNEISDVRDAKVYLAENLPRIQQLANETLDHLGFPGDAVVTLCKEIFDVRHYDTFSLPSGVYDSLRIVIGEGLGKNWWCVSFPTLCIPATTAGFSEAAVSAGFSDPLIQSLSGNDNYQIHFFLLDQLGRLENIFFQD